MNIALYFDVENVNNLNLSDLMNSLIDKERNNNNITVKLAVGKSEATAKYRSELLNHNFMIIETPHIIRKKNRADIMLSIIAYEDFIYHKPEIDQFVFITSDSDYTFIMDKLKRNGKIVWLVCKAEDREKEYFRNCTDNIISIESNIKIKKSLAELQKWLKENGFDESESQKLINYFPKNEWKKIDNFGFNYTNKKIKGQVSILKKLTDECFLEKKKSGNTSVYKIAAT